MGLGFLVVARQNKERKDGEDVIKGSTLGVSNRRSWEKLLSVFVKREISILFFCEWWKDRRLYFSLWNVIQTLPHLYRPLSLPIFFTLIKTCLQRPVISAPGSQLNCTEYSPSSRERTPSGSRKNVRNWSCPLTGMIFVSGGNDLLVTGVCTAHIIKTLLRQNKKVPPY